MQSVSVRRRAAGALAIACASTAFLVGCDSTASMGSATRGTAEMSMEEIGAAMQAYGTPGEPHATLARKVGSWTVDNETWMSPDGDPEVSAASANFSLAMGGRYLEQRYRGEMMGMPFDGVGITGFNNASGEYEFTWRDSLSTGVAWGTGRAIDENTMEFVSTSVDPITRQPTTMRMVDRWIDDDTFVFEMYGEGPDGEEVRSMVMTYRRR